MSNVNDGLYIYENGNWVQKSQEDFTEGIHIVYFNNRDCFACKVFDSTWSEFVKLPDLSGVRFWMVVCTWFSKKCSNERAKWLFENYQIKSSPTTLIIRDGVILETIKGSLSLDELKERVKKVLEGKREKEKSKESTRGYVC